jgi:hypothetical protein
MKASDPEKRSIDIPSDLRSECNMTSYASVFFEEDLQISRVLLEESKHRNVFLTRVGIAFTIVFGWLLALCVAVRINHKSFEPASVLWIHGSVRSLFYCCLLTLKFVLAYYSTIARKRPWLFLALDVSLLSTFVILLTLEYDTQTFETASLNENWTFIVLLNFFVSYGIFTLTTLYSSPDKIYNYWFGLFCMWLVSTFTVLTLYFTREPLLVEVYQYILLLLFCVALDSYLALNAYFVVKYRTQKFYTNEFIFCYFRFWTDWFSFFWKDLIQLSEAVQANIHRAARDRQRKKAKEVSFKKKNNRTAKNQISVDSL